MADGDDKGRAKVPAIYHTVDDREGLHEKQMRQKSDFCRSEVAARTITINWDRLEDRCTGILQ